MIRRTWAFVVPRSTRPPCHWRAITPLAPVSPARRPQGRHHSAGWSCARPPSRSAESRSADRLRLRSITDYVDAGLQAAPHASVAIQLAGQAAKAQARMGNPSDVRRALDQGARLLDDHGHPLRPENHFVVDPNKWDFYAMDCYRIVGEDARAAEHAHEILRMSARPDGTDRSPMRASEARLTLSVVSLRDGDVDGAAEWARQAFSADRKSVNSLQMVAEELHNEAQARYGSDPAIGVAPATCADISLRLPGRPPAAGAPGVWPATGRAVVPGAGHRHRRRRLTSHLASTTRP
jgi:hypothetical protein